MYVNNLLKVLTQQCTELESKCGPRGHQSVQTLPLLYQTTQNSNLLKTYFSALFINVPCTFLTMFCEKVAKYYMQFMQLDILFDVFGELVIFCGLVVCVIDCVVL